MFEKLCAILDALRACGIDCKAECAPYSGIWEIVAYVPVRHGVKVSRVPLSHTIVCRLSIETLIKRVLIEVGG